jgi:hypothetical protein
VQLHEYYALAGQVRLVTCYTDETSIAKGPPTMKRALLLPALFATAISCLSLACNESSESSAASSGGALSTGGGHSSGGAGAAAGTSGAEVDPGCADFTELRCEETPECASIKARGIGEAEQHWVGCRFGGIGDALSSCVVWDLCGYPTSGDGACLLFSMDCLPEGWTKDLECDDRPDCPDLRPWENEGGAGGGRP